MDTFVSSPTMHRVLVTVLIVVAILLLATFVSYAQFLVYGLLADVRERAQSFRALVLRKSDRFCGDRLAAFWKAREIEPRAPVVAELNRLNDAIATIGEPQVRAIAEAERRMGAHLQALRNIQRPEGPDAANDREYLVEAASGSSIFGLLFLAVFALLIGAVNSFLLAIFFREVIGSYRVLPYPLPDLQAANLIAFIIFLAEVATGWAIYRSGEHRANSAKAAAGSGFFRVVPWVMLAVLAVVELAAYSTLSVRVNLAGRLHIENDSPIYAFAQYFLSFLGIGLTLLLAYLGHAISESVAERRRTALARSIVSSLRKGKKTALEQAGRLSDLIDSIRRTVADFPQSIANDFMRELGIRERREPALVTVEKFTVGALTAPDRTAPNSLVPVDVPNAFTRAVRTRSQVWGDLFVAALLLLALILLAGFTTFEVVSFLLEGPQATNAFIAWAAGVATPMLVIGLGLVGWNALRSLRYANPLAPSLPERRGRLVIVWVTTIALVAATIALIAVGIAVGGGHLPLVFGALAVAQAAALACLSGFLDRGIVAVLHLAHLVWIAVVRIGALALAAMASVLDAVCFVSRVAIRLIAIPGDVLRGRTDVTSPFPAP